MLELPGHDISTDESFFNLGGHSILLSRLLLRLREEFGRSISINRFIELPTIRKLATLVRGTDDRAVLSEQAMADAERTLDIEPLPINRMGDVHKVIVTGANSFVGVHIVEALLGWGPARWLAWCATAVGKRQRSALLKHCARTVSSTWICAGCASMRRI